VAIVPEVCTASLRKASASHHCVIAKVVGSVRGLEHVHTFLVMRFEVLGVGPHAKDQKKHKNAHEERAMKTLHESRVLVLVGNTSARFD
jgi:hypothetical protein